LIESKLSELTQRLFSAKGSYEIGKIKQSVEKLKRQNAENFGVDTLLEKVNQSFDWEKKQEEEKEYNRPPRRDYYPPYPYHDYRGSSSSSVLIWILLLVLLIYFALKRC